MTRRQSATICVVSTLLALGAAAPRALADGPAHIVKDLTTGTEPSASSDPGPFFDIGSTILFFAGDDTHGRELWRTDGTEDGTVMVKDVAPGPADGTAYIGYATGGGALYFRTVDNGLWRSDGTTAGTVKISDLLPDRLIADGNRLFALVIRDYEGADLWRIDLPSGAATLLHAFTGAYVEPSFTLIAGRLFFAAADGMEGLWTSDGTIAGTHLVRAVQIANREGGNESTELIAVGGLLFFSGHDEAGWEPWRSDGTEAGTYRLRDINPTGNGLHFNDYWETTRSFFTAFGDQLVFMADDGLSGLELWRSDGTQAGTMRIAEIAAGPRGADGVATDDDNSDVAQSTIHFLRFEDRLYFTARPNGLNIELWVTDGSASGTHAVAPLTREWGSIYSAVVGANHMFFTINSSAGLQVLTSDGTPSGSVVVASTFSTSMLPTENGIVFAGADEIAGREPWTSDGTAAGTSRVADLARGMPGLDPQDLIDLGGTLLFSARDTEHGRELWRSDGTEIGTQLVRDITAGGASSSPLDLTASGASLFLTADDGNGRALWRSDGTSAGTVRVSAEPIQPVALAADGRGGVYFLAQNPAEQSLWHSDGTPGGTQLLRAANDPVHDSVLPPLALDNVAVFAVRDPAKGRQLWRTDGTPGGTIAIADLPTPPGSYPAIIFVRVGDVAFLFAHDDHGDTQLWRTDGTAAGTRYIAFTEQPAGRPTLTDDGRFYFLAYGQLSLGLWQSDGTAAGTFREPGSFQSREVAAVGDRVFTIRSDRDRAYFSELGCGSLLDFALSYGRQSEQLAHIDGRLLVVAPVGEERRIWTSDGSASGTSLLQVLPAPSGTDPLPDPRFVRAGDRVYFANRDGGSGRELWALPLAAVPPLGSAACEPVPTPTPVPGRPTPPVPFECEQGVPCIAIQAQPDEAEPGEDVTLFVALHTLGEDIVAVQNDVLVPIGIEILANGAGRPACAVEPSLGEFSASFGFQPPGCTPNVDCDGIRALVLSFVDVSPIYDGAVLYRCAARVSPDVENGDLILSLLGVGGSDSDGAAVRLSGIGTVLRVVDSDNRPIGQAAGSSDGCQTTAANGSMAGWLQIGVLALLFAGVRHSRERESIRFNFSSSLTDFRFRRDAGVLLAPPDGSRLQPGDEVPRHSMGDRRRRLRRDSGHRQPPRARAGRLLGTQ